MSNEDIMGEIDSMLSEAYTQNKRQAVSIPPYSRPWWWVLVAVWIINVFNIWGNLI